VLIRNSELGWIVFVCFLWIIFLLLLIFLFAYLLEEDDEE